MTLSDRPAIPIPLDIVELIPSANGTATARAVRDTSIASQTVPPMHSSATPAAATAAPTPASTAVTDQRWIPISTTSSISSPGIVSSQPAAVPQMDPKKPISSADLSGNRKNKEGKLKTKWTQCKVGCSTKRERCQERCTECCANASVIPSRARPVTFYDVRCGDKADKVSHFSVNARYHSG